MKNVNVFMGLWVSFVISFYSSSVLAQDNLGTIRISSEVWKNATESNGRGMYWDLIRRVYEPKGIRVILSTSTYARSVGLMKEGEVDAMVGAYIGEVQGALYPRWHFDADVVAALYRKGAFHFSGESSFKNKHIASIKGYKLSEYIDPKFKVHEYYDRKQIFELLEEGKIDVFVDALMDIKSELKKGTLSPGQFETGIVKKLKLYIVFTDNARGRYLRSIFDERFERLLIDGEVKQIFEGWSWPTYPFEQ